MTLRGGGRRVVVTGLGAVTPLGKTVAETWTALSEGCSGIRQITRFDASGLRCTIAGEVPELPCLDFLNPRDARKMERFMLLGLCAAHEAIADSGLKIDVSNAPEVGTIMGCAIGGLPMIEQASRVVIEQSANKLTPFMLPATLINMLAGHVSMTFGLQGYAACAVSACASSAHAIGDAARLIERGDAIAMIAGGAESAITPLCIGGFGAMRALSTRNAEPARASRPFDAARDGFVVSEGAAVLVLEEREHALARGAQIYGELAGYGFSADAKHMTIPSEEGPARAMRRALRDAQVSPERVDYLNAHATGTPLGDANEAKAIEAVFAGAPALWVGSTKSMTGHLLGAAGALEAVIALLAMRHGQVPPSVNLDSPDAACGFRFAPSVASRKPVRAVLSNSFGFGGSNAALVFVARDWH